MVSKLSPVMQVALDKARPAGLVRWAGGFWTTPDDPGTGRTVQNGWGTQNTVPVPSWYVTAGTVDALLVRNLLVPAEKNGRGFITRVVLPG